jgi:hypothetical protein
VIRRAQAEALLKLAEALEECERLDLSILSGLDGDIAIHQYAEWHRTTQSRRLTGMSIRLAVNTLVPKSEQAE